MAKLSQQQLSECRIRRRKLINIGKKTTIIPWLKKRSWDLNINDLPAGVLLKIFSFVPQTDLFSNAKLVCKKWYTLASSAYLWTSIAVGPDISGEMILHWLENSPNLLNLQVRNRIDAGEILRKVQKYNKNIKHIKIHDCWGCERRINIPSTPLCNVLLRCPYLDSISLRGSRFISCKFFRLLVSRNKLLAKRKRKINHKFRTKNVQFYGSALKKQLRTYFKTKLDNNEKKLTILTVDPTLCTNGSNNITREQKFMIQDENDIERILNSLHFE